MYNPPPKTPETPPPSGDDMAIDSMEHDDRITHYDTVTEPQFAASHRVEVKLVSLGIATALVVVLGAVFLLSLAETNNPSLQQQIVTLPQDEVIAKDYKLIYASGGSIYQYDPIKNESGAATVSASPTLDHQVGDYYPSTSDGKTTVVSRTTSETIVQFEDPDVTIGNIYVSPSGQYLAVDLKPVAATLSKWGVRLGLYEIDILNKTMAPLVPESSPGQGDASYTAHLVQALSWSPDSRYIAYNRAAHLWLYDRYSGVSLDIADVGTTNRTPTAWQN